MTSRYRFYRHPSIPMSLINSYANFTYIARARNNLKRFVFFASHTHSGGGMSGAGRGDDVVRHFFVEDINQRIFGTAQTPEVVHIDRPRHRAEVTLLLDPIHFNFYTPLVLVSNPLGALESVGAFAMLVPLFSPARIFLIHFSTDLEFKNNIKGLQFREALRSYLRITLDKENFKSVSKPI